MPQAAGRIVLLVLGEFCFALPCRQAQWTLPRTRFSAAFDPAASSSWRLLAGFPLSASRLDGLVASSSSPSSLDQAPVLPCSVQDRSISSWAEAGAAQAFSRSQAWEKHHPERLHESRAAAELPMDVALLADVSCGRPCRHGQLPLVPPEILRARAVVPLIGLKSDWASWALDPKTRRLATPPGRGSRRYCKRRSNSIRKRQ